MAFSADFLVFTLLAVFVLWIADWWFADGWMHKLSTFKVRLKTTRDGSAHEIGWIQRQDGFEVDDLTHKYELVLKSIREEKQHRLPKTYVYYFVPGLFSNYGPEYFLVVKNYFEKELGLDCRVAEIHSEACAADNAERLRADIVKLYETTGKQVLLVCHSKGGVDSCAACSLYPVLEGKIAGIVLSQCPYGGSPIASDIMREGQIGGQRLQRVLEKLPKFMKMVGRVIFVDQVRNENIKAAVKDLTYEERQKFTRANPLPRWLRILCFSTEAKKCDMALSRTGYFKLPCQDGERKHRLFLPLGIVMGVVAWYIMQRYGEASDGLVACKDAEVPGSIVVRSKENMHHSSTIFSSRGMQSNVRDDTPQVHEALITVLLVESRLIT